MSKVKYKNPFAMGNLDDLMYARENDDVEYLKEWSKKAVTQYEVMRGIQIGAYNYIIMIRNQSNDAVDKIHNSLSQTIIEKEKEQ